MKTKKYDYHPIANTYPMMSKKEFNNLIGSMEDNGFDEKYPIILFEDKILDGRNRYEASKKAKVKPLFEKFEGSFGEAVEKSRQLNSYRRNLAKSQKAMVAAKEVKLSRESEGKNLSVNKASMLHDVSEGYIKIGMSILEKDKELAQSVFDGNMTIGEASYRLEQIEALRAPVAEDTENFHESDQDAQTQELIQEFSEDNQAAASRVIELQENYLTAMEELKFYRENCDKHPS